jgi:pyridoxamine 5'-phosphate oxidase
MAHSSIADLRKDYALHSLSEKDVAVNPFVHFSAWWQQATQAAIDEVNAMTLSTIAANGYPESRIVLLKGYDEKGFVFFTNYESAKGVQLKVQPQCSLLFFWKELERQIRIIGKASPIAATESDTYYQSRPVGSQIGAWASPQSQVVDSKEWLEENFAQMEKKYQGQSPIPRPPHWGGFRIEPIRFEFWQGRPSRMHDRICYTREQELNWKIERLAP